jgi:peroxiredoxin Q/BCP
MKPNDLAPDFELPDQLGVPRRLSTLLSDGPVALFFYPVASSGGCTKEMCAVRARGAVSAAYGVARSMAAAPVKRHTIVVGTDGRVADVVRSEFRFGKHAAKALDALR